MNKMTHMSILFTTSLSKVIKDVLIKGNEPIMPIVVGCDMDDRGGFDHIYGL
ncbi:hypothetical protein AHAS_Ahas13G0349700 [Arachis hypogaea]